jgi:hypothetical protein
MGWKSNWIDHGIQKSRERGRNSLTLFRSLFRASLKAWMEEKFKDKIYIKWLTYSSSIS